MFVRRVLVGVLSRRGRPGQRRRVMRLPARATWLGAPGPRHVDAPGAVCPRCHRAAGLVSLLTGAAIYYSCAHCSHGWSDVPPVPASVQAA